MGKGCITVILLGLLAVSAVPAMAEKNKVLDKRIGTASDPCDFVAFSPDGEHIACRASRNGHSGTLIMTLGGKDVAFISGGWSAPVWSPDGKRVAVLIIGEEGDLYKLVVRDVETGVDAVLVEGIRNAQDLSWHPTKAELWYSAGRPPAMRYVTINDRMDRAYDGAPGNRAGAWSVRGDLVYTRSQVVDGKESMEVVVRRAAGDVKVLKATNVSFGVRGVPVWSPDGTMLACNGRQSADSKEMQLWVSRVDSEDSDFRPIAQSTGYFVKWDPTAPRILTAQYSKSAKFDGERAVELALIDVPTAAVATVARPKRNCTLSHPAIDRQHIAFDEMCMAGKGEPHTRLIQIFDRSTAQTSKRASQ